MQVSEISNLAEAGKTEEASRTALLKMRDRARRNISFHMLKSRLKPDGLTSPSGIDDRSEKVGRIISSEHGADGSSAGTNPSD
jgi:hypothetical protein